ncbi:hypothetical protein [Sphingomonas yantingensis]|uniref:Uncharacterized protein n=1 Tax=Sphingomonas yantingensis TaxID=1241761 RepID=A0A7W9EJB2_9SPHN|nr:hypothetical protein [Sphingomonas yantingensis]MBB5700047.1 hypothetical protein [Sphingomonas yantingensis]
MGVYRRVVSIGRANHSSLIGAVTGAFATLPALVTAIMSAGAGHGDYIAARLLFPLSMLLSWVEGSGVGPLGMMAGLLQFPLYGVLVARALKTGPDRAAIVAAAAHLTAVIACFGGLLPDFA